MTANARPSARIEADLHPDDAIATGQEFFVLASRIGETAIASVKTIGARADLFARASGDPMALTNPEFTLLATEKAVASGQAGLALSEALRAQQETWSAWFAGQGTRTILALLELGRCQSLSAAIAVHNSYIDASVTSAKNAGAVLTGAASRMSGAALAPFHRAVMANAERLAPAK